MSLETTMMNDDPPPPHDPKRRGSCHPANIGDIFNVARQLKLGWGHFSTTWFAHSFQRNRVAGVYSLV
ncbi:hypothetical protein DFP72DRAFT_923069 [Ephemerocybe angulata]|uniref:Uncharacterized protein n=1 Tax=Ephemerocybe angulata TaxID=980116 RepID=A0A8H6LYZ9_9AGAR|nr:hypothetical protein DFP72DRAFT_923069 [Tulosesus angulatus]